MADTEYKLVEENMGKTINVLHNEFSTMRAGRANPSVLDKIRVDYYGTPTPINQIANISVPEARLIMIQPWDASIIGAIEREIQKSDIGINPNNDGKVIRLVFPVLTEERRKELTKRVKKYGEEAKVAIRQIRRDAIEKYKKMQKNGDITEDDLADSEKDIQKLTDDFTKKIDDMIKEKDEEILEV